MNLGDPELELVDPTPNIHSLFIHFDKIFFWAKLASRAVVRWSKRMYSSAGICSYEGRGGLCDIALSEPLLKLRPRKDLVETLLHEMIHAFLFVTNRDQDRDGHGPNFQAHMHRINNAAGLNISIYHDFHDEVKLYQTHWWRCNGPCQNRRPHFGIVRRTSNRAPGPYECWWNDHLRQCGGTFIKIKEPENRGKKKASVSKPKEDITKYITSQKIINNKVPTNNKKTSINNTALPPNVHTIKSILKDNTNTCGVKSNGNMAATVTQKTNDKKGDLFSPQNNKPPVFIGKGNIIGSGKDRSNPVDAAEAVRNIWANKKLSNTEQEDKRKKTIKPYILSINNTKSNTAKRNSVTQTNFKDKTANSSKSRASSTPTNSPPAKIMKIDDYFKTAATVLKDIYGQDFNITQNESKKLVATVSTNDNKNIANNVRNNSNQKTNEYSKGIQVDCPICNIKVDNNDINRHLDECLNKDIVNSLSQEVVDSVCNKKNTLTNITIGKIETIDLIQEIDTFRNISKEDTVNNSQDDTLYSNVDSFTNEPSTSKSFSVTGISSVNVNTNSMETPVDFESGEPIKIEPEIKQECACCGNKIDKPIEEHLDECLAFFDNNSSIPEEGASTSFSDGTIVIDDDDDQFDESQTLNETGTKFPCPCCLEMVEEVMMNKHLDTCIM